MQTASLVYALKTTNIWLSMICKNKIFKAAQWISFVLSCSGVAFSAFYLYRKWHPEYNYWQAANASYLIGEPDMMFLYLMLSWIVPFIMGMVRARKLIEKAATLNVYVINTAIILLYLWMSYDMQSKIMGFVVIYISFVYVIIPFALVSVGHILYGVDSTINALYSVRMHYVLLPMIPIMLFTLTIELTFNENLLARSDVDGLKYFYISVIGGYIIFWCLSCKYCLMGKVYREISSLIYIEYLSSLYGDVPSALCIPISKKADLEWMAVLCFILGNMLITAAYILHNLYLEGMLLGFAQGMLTMFAVVGSQVFYGLFKLPAIPAE